MSRKQIWLNPPLEKLAEQCGEAKGRDGKFSRRLGDVVERFEAIMVNTPVPAMTDEEIMILGAAVSGSTINAIAVRYLHESIADLGIAGDKELSEKVRTWSAAERVSAIESLDK